MIKKYWKIAAAAAFLTAAGFCYGFLRSEPEESRMRVPGPDGILEITVMDEETESGDGVWKSAEEAGAAEADGGAAGAGVPADPETAAGETVFVELCYVHICGEVAKPGVYELPYGSRIFQAVEAAGGMTEQAAADSVNLAVPVQDGMRVKIPSQEEVESLGEEEFHPLSAGAGQETKKGAELVNLNTAGSEELMTLNGIGKARAEEIIRYRTENGNFQSIEDIKDIPGIKDALFQKIKDSITV